MPEARGERQGGLAQPWLAGILVVLSVASASLAQQPAPSPSPAPTRMIERFREGLPPLPGELFPRDAADGGPPGLPARGGRPIPGSIFDPGASGPGIGSINSEMFLGGALDPKTGWPFVWLDHFEPQPDRVRNLWVVHTRDCPQVMGSDPWPCMKVLHFDEDGELEERDLNELLRSTIGHPVLIQVQGSLTTPDIALGGLLWTHSWLDHNHALPPDVVIIAFDWPSQRVYRLDVKDINEKGRRAYIAAYHLARFVQAFPSNSRICLLGQSYGGRVVTSALHLLGGGALNSQDHDPYVTLPCARPDLDIRTIILGAAVDHNWLNPGQRLDRALYGCEMFMNFYNSRDEALFLYPLLVRSGHRRALGRIGLNNGDLERLGPLAARYQEHNVNEHLGLEHTLLDAVANPEIARRIAPYIWAPDPGPLPPYPDVPAEPAVRRLSILPRIWE